MSPRHAMTQFLVKKIRKFERDESGALIFFTLVLFLLMVMMGGVAVDVMRYETIRTELQNTLDRCVLMAASLDQKLDAEKVVRDCVGKAGLANELAKVEVVQGLNRRDVTATGLAPTSPFFLHLIGIDKFDAKGKSGAAQAINNVEIALVLDVSGSMGGTKIANLKIAAQEFVDTVKQGDDRNRVSISIVPYNAQVNLGADLMNEYDVQKRNRGNNGTYATNSYCLELPSSSYKNPRIPKQSQLNQMAHADYMYNTNYSFSYVAPTDANYAKPNFNSTFCRTNLVNQVRVPSTDATTIKAQIAALQAGGNTSILMGMKWGVTMLDPDTRPVFQDLAAKGLMNVDLSVRPFDYNDRDVTKIVVVMTDGEHVSHNLISDDYKVGNSGIYKANDGKYSVLIDKKTGSSRYWVPHLATWSTLPYKPTGGSAEQQDWTDIWANLKVSYVAWQFYALPSRAMGEDANTAFYAKFNDMVKTNASVTEMDSRLQEACTAAKANNIRVYGIAFQAPSNGQKQIRDCSSSESHYYNAQGADIKSAFSSIASDITKLRLTQ